MMRYAFLTMAVFLFFSGCSKTVFVHNYERQRRNYIDLTDHHPLWGLLNRNKKIEIDGWILKIEYNDEIIPLEYDTSYKRNFYRNRHYVFETSTVSYAANIFQAAATKRNTLHEIIIYYEADPDTFEPFYDDPDYSKDKLHVFYKAQIINQLDHPK